MPHPATTLSFVAALAVSSPVASVHAAPSPATRARTDTKTRSSRPKPRVAKPRPARARSRTTIPASDAKKKPKVVKKAKNVDHYQHRVWVQIVRLADDDGGRASTITEASAQAAIAEVNEVWKRNGGEIRFRLHPASNLDAPIKSTLLNSDCLLQPGYTPSNIASVTTADLDGNGKGAELEDMDVLCDTTRSIVARSSYAARRADRIVVWSRGGRFRVHWSSKDGHWNYVKMGASSSHASPYVQIQEWVDGRTLAHEIGHYLHLPHTFGPQPATKAAAAQAMYQFSQANPGKDPRLVFNGDAADWLAPLNMQITDTPPDPGPRMWKSIWGDPCIPSTTSTTLSILVDGDPKSYGIVPDRNNAMSYFFSCATMNPHLSSQQLATAYHALLHRNRTELIATKGKSECYEKGSAPGVLAQTPAQLAQVLAGVAACRLEENLGTYDKSVYRVEKRLPKGYSRRGKVGVHRVRERALLDAILRTSDLD